MQENNHINVATMSSSKHKAQKNHSYIFDAFKNAMLLTLATYTFILIFSILAAIFVFTCSSAVLQVMFNSLPIILSMVFLFSIANSINDVKKNHKEKRKA